MFKLHVVLFIVTDLYFKSVQENFVYEEPCFEKKKMKSKIK